ncbi:hypothetical protein ABZ656_33835 [Streptomyces sp. NPDC007095]|uniref:hypothetical protein n=1 Tax=Streptomyces sp. NPDC007095 TaxID=3154482 RepID=UPI0033FB5AF3
MTRYAVTGHMDLTDDSVALVREALREVFAAHTEGELVGVSCIAAGADSIFAEELLAAGGRLVVVLPSQDYRQAKVKPQHAAVFDHLVESAVEVVVMPHENANRQAYEAANGELLRRGDRLVAVWDGTPPSGKGGGTADTVEQARAEGLAVDVVWPKGAARRS